MGYIPSNLQLFVNEIGGTICNRAHIGQALMQMAKPRGPILPPLQLLMGLKCHKQFGSRNLVDTLHAAGFCSSYDEVCKFERCAAVTVSDINSNDSTFIQVTDISIFADKIFSHKLV